MSKNVEVDVLRNFSLVNKPMPPLELRHSAKVEFNNKISVDDKMEYLERIREEFGIVYSDIVSIEESSNIIAKFTAVEDVELDYSETPIEMHDRGRVELYDNHMYIKIEMSFARLVAFHAFTTQLLGDNVRNMLVYHNENPKGVPSA